jgi:MFS family permease
MARTRLTDFSSVTAALRQRNFGIYMAGSSVGLLGLWVQRVAIGWLTWQLTHSGIWLGIIAFADLFPTMLITPFAGALADRLDRRLMSLVSQALAMVQAFALALLTFAGLIDIWSLLALTLFLGIVYAFNTAARLSMVPNLLETRYVPSAIAIDSAVFNLARFLGPAIAGAIIVNWGVGPAFLFNALSFVCFLAALYHIRMIRHETGGKKTGGVMSQVLEGFRYARDHPGIGPMLVIIFAMAVGVKPFLELLPGFADAVFDRGAQGLAYLTAVAGLGAFTTALWMAQRGTAVGLTKVVIGALVLGGVAIFIFTATDIYAVGLIGAYFAGASVTLGGTGTQTLMQNVVDGAMRGRVMSLYGMIYRGAPAFGALIMGSASEVVGLRAAVAVGGVICIVVAVWMYRHRATMTPALEREQPGAA